jgi:RHS repeat-associated protein
MWYTCVLARRPSFDFAQDKSGVDLLNNRSKRRAGGRDALYPLRGTGYPYGEERWVNGGAVTDYTFAGQRAERGLGLMDYQARYYDPKLGRFVGADTVVVDYANPQTLNRYAYTANNPVKYVDPSGNCHGLSGATFDACVKVVVAIASGVHKANEYRDDIFFPDANTTFADRLEASMVVGGGATFFAGAALYAAPAATTSAAVGSVTGAGGNLTAQVAGGVAEGESLAKSSQSVEWADVAIAGGTGFVAGGLAPVVGTSPVGNIALGSGANTAQYAATQKVHGRQIEAQGAVDSAILGGFVNGVLGPLPRDTKYFSPNWPSMKDAAAAELREIQMGTILSKVGLSRALGGATATNIDWRELWEDSFSGPPQY